VLGEQHPDYAVSLDNLAGWYRKEGNKEEAEKNYLEALAIRGVALGNDHPDYAASLNNLAVFYQEQNKLAEAGQAYKQTLDIFKNKLGENHPDYGRVLRNLAVFYEERGKLEEAEKYFIKAVKIVLRQINTTFPSLSEDEKKQFYLVNKDFIDGFMRFAFSSSALRLKQGQTKLPILGDAYNLQLATKALILNSTSKVRRRIMASGNQALIQKYED
jgi:tetratricopeptide (TPR) repeat protein